MNEIPNRVNSLLDTLILKKLVCMKTTKQFRGELTDTLAKYHSPLTCRAIRSFVGEQVDALTASRSQPVFLF